MIYKSDAKQTVLKSIINQGVLVHLYTNDAQILGDSFAFEEPNDPNYQPILLEKGWSINEDGIATHGGVKFIFSKVGQRVAGWFLTNKEGDYLGAVVEDKPFEIRVKGDSVEVQPFLVSR